MSAPARVEATEDMVVDGQGVDPPTAEWMRTAQRAAETDGIFENAAAKAQASARRCAFQASCMHAHPHSRARRWGNCTRRGRRHVESICGEQGRSLRVRARAYARADASGQVL